MKKCIFIILVILSLCRISHAEDIWVAEDNIGDYYLRERNVVWQSRDKCECKVIWLSKDRSHEIVYIFQYFYGYDYRNKYCILRFSEIWSERKTYSFDIDTGKEINGFDPDKNPDEITMIETVTLYESEIDRKIYEKAKEYLT